MGTWVIELFEFAEAIVVGMAFATAVGAPCTGIIRRSRALVDGAIAIIIEAGVFVRFIVVIAIVIVVGVFVRFIVVVEVWFIVVVAIAGVIGIASATATSARVVVARLPVVARLFGDIRISLECRRCRDSGGHSCCIWLNMCIVVSSRFCEKCM